MPQARDYVNFNYFNLYGYRPLVEQIARRYGVERDQVVTTTGCSMGNYLACAAVAGAGDEVLIEKPAYEPLLSVARLVAARIKRFSRPFSRGFQVDLDDYASKLTPRTRVVMLSNLHNPSGVLISEDTLCEIGRLAWKVGAYVLVDEVYLDFVFDRRPRSAVQLGEHFIVTSSLTKAYGLDGLRCGWILTNPKLAAEIWRLQDFFGVNGAVPAEKLSTLAFENMLFFERRSRTVIEANRPVVDEFLDAHADQLECVRPDAGPVCFPRLRGDEDGSQFAERLFNNYSVRVIPGRFFEMAKHFRLGFGGRTEALRAGLKRASQALRQP
jgi:aspartate/methionine/tyrosine aminotransferase